MKKKLIIFLGFFISLSAYAAEEKPLELQGVDIVEHLGNSLTLDFPMVDQFGESVTLRKYVNGSKPVILAFVYYDCPNLCHFLMNGLTESLKSLEWSVGDQFELVAISVDSRETPKMAGEKFEEYIKMYNRNQGKGWHFLTAKKDVIEALTKEVGFGFRYDADQDEFAHSSAIYFLTPLGKISRYLYGIRFEKLDLKLALLEASEGKIGSMVDKLLMFCYRYDPKGRKYGIYAMNLMRGAGAITVFGIGTLLLVGNRRKKEKES